MFVSQPLTRGRRSVLLLGVFLGAVLASTSGLAAPVPAERAKSQRELAALGTKLHGEWVGGPCVGQLTFRADGRYEWKGRGPAGFSEEGTWTLRGEPAAPVLILKCKNSAHEARIGTTVEMKLNRVDEAGFVFTEPETSTLKRFKPVKKSHVP